MPYRVAVVGAVGAVGREILRTLSDREFPASQVTALASGRAVGAQVSFGDRDLKVGAVERFDFEQCDLAIMAPAAAISAVQAPVRDTVRLLRFPSSHIGLAVGA